MGFNDFKEIRQWWNPSGNGAIVLSSPSSSYSFVGDNTIVTLSSGSGGGGVLHASLSSPLTASGVGLRAKMLGAKLIYGGSYWSTYPSNAPPQPAFQHLLVLNTSTRPEFNLVPPTKAISLRAWVRSAQMIVSNGVQQPNGNYNLGCGIIAKAHTGSYQHGDSFTYPPSPPEIGGAGYRLGFSNIDGTTGNFASNPGTFFRLKLFALNEQRLYSSNVYNWTLPAIGAITCTGTYEANKWYHLRLDIVPGGNGSDLLIAYTGNGAENETWTEVGRLTVPSTATTAYCSWQNPKYNGYGMYCASKMVISQNPNSYDAYFDKFEAFIEDV